MFNERKLVMSKTQVIGDMSAWAGMMKDFWRQVSDGSITIIMFAAFLQHKNPFAISDIRVEWQEFYRKYFRMSVDFSDVQIPDNSGGFDRAIFIPKGLKINDVLKAIRKQFPTWSYEEDPDKDVIENIRQSDRNYAIRIRERVEADEEFKDTSANSLRERGVNVITLLERLVFELKYFSETSEHLDVSNVTLCAGSRGRVGGVPYVSWRADHRGELRIDWCPPDVTSVRIRARQAVS